MRLLVNPGVFFVLLGIALPSWSQQPAEIVIRDGTIVTSEGRFGADVRTRDGVIVEIGVNLEAGAGARELDATGLLVIPGGVDPHVHLGADVDDDFESGSRSALAGGMTTISNFPFPEVPVLSGAFPQQRQTLARAVEREVPLIRQQAIADFMLHPVIDDPDAQQQEMATLATDTGQTSVKVFMARPDFDDNIRGYLAILDAAGEAGILTMVHCEDGPIVDRAVEKLTAEGRTSLQYFPDSRPRSLRSSPPSGPWPWSRRRARRSTSCTCRRRERCGSPSRRRLGACPCTSKPGPSICTSPGSVSTVPIALAISASRRCGPRAIRTPSGRESPTGPSMCSLPTTAASTTCR